VGLKLRAVFDEDGGKLGADLGSVGSCWVAASPLHSSSLLPLSTLAFFISLSWNSWKSSDDNSSNDEMEDDVDDDNFDLLPNFSIQKLRLRMSFNTSLEMAFPPPIFPSASS